MTVDHIIAESCNSIDELDKIRTLYSLPNDFAINSYANWVPAHSKCNQRKSYTLFEPSPALVLIFDRVSRKVDEAEKIEQRLLKQRKSDSVMAQLQALIEADVISWEDVKEQFETKAEGCLSVGEPPNVKVSLPSQWRVVAVRDEQAVVTDGHRTGFTPIGSPHISWLCGHCSNYGPWSGARCLTCGMLSHPDD